MNRLATIGGLVMLTVSLAFSYSMQSGYELVHVTPREAVEGENLELEAIFSGDLDAIASAKILYRLAGQIGYLEEPMRLQEMKLVGEIPGETIGAPAIEYVLVVSLTDGGLMAFPPVEDPLSEPARVPVIEGSGVVPEDAAWDQQIVVLTPDPGAVIAFGEPMLVAVSLFNLENVDINSVRIFFDNVDVTAYSLVTTDLITYKPETLRSGRHTIYIEVSNIYGVRIGSKTWNFTVQSQAQRLFDVNFRGSLNLSHREDIINLVSTSVDSIIDGDTVAVNLYEPQGNQVSRLDFSTDANFDWASIKVFANLTSKEDSTLQPQNRYGVKVRTSWLRYTYGDATPMVNRLGLWGKRVRGHSVDLRFKYANLQFVRGKTRRAITGGARYDSTAGEWQRTGYTFEQGLTGSRFALRAGRVFELGTFFVHTRDSVNSIKVQPAWWSGEDYYHDLILDTLGNTQRVEFGDEEVILDTNATSILYALRGMAPEDNVVMGSDFELSVDNRRFLLRGSAAFSLYNRNILEGALTRAELDTFGLLQDDTSDGYIGSDGEGGGLIALEDLDSKIGSIPVIGSSLLSDGQFDPANMEGFFILNENMTLPVDFDKISSNPLAGLSSIALNLAVRLNYFGNFISADYHHIGPSYRAFGNPVLRTDRTGWSGWKVTDKIRLLNNMLYLNLGWESYKTNTASIDELVDPRTAQKTFSGGFTLNPGRGLPTVTTNLKYYTRDNNIDTLNYNEGVLISDPRELNQTLTSNLNLSYSLMTGHIGNTISLNVMNSGKEDLVEGRTGQMRSARLYGINVRTEYGIPLITNILFRSNANQQYEPGNEQYASNEFITFGGSAGYRLFRDRLNLRTGFQSITFTKESFGNSSQSQSQLNWDVNLQYKLPALTLGEYVIKSRFIAGAEVRRYSGDFYEYSDNLWTVKYDLVF